MIGHSMRFFGLLALATLLASCASPPRTPEQLVQVYADAVNSGRADRVVALYAPDAEVRLSVSQTLRGEQLRALAQYDSALHTTLTLSGVQVSNDTVFCWVDQSSDWYRALGIQGVRLNCAFALRGGKIAAVDMRITPESHTVLHSAFYQAADWASRERPDDLERLMPGGAYQYTAEAATDWVALLNDWRGSIAN